VRDLVALDLDGLDVRFEIRARGALAAFLGLGPGRVDVLVERIDLLLAIALQRGAVLAQLGIGGADLLVGIGLRPCLALACVDRVLIELLLSVGDRLVVVLARFGRLVGYILADFGAVLIRFAPGILNLGVSLLLGFDRFLLVALAVAGGARASEDRCDNEKES
jgi:hypothetical protein